MEEKKVNEKEGRKSIDDALIKCQDSIERHRGEASKLFRIIIIVLIFFGLIQGMSFISNSLNDNKLSDFSNNLDSQSQKISSDLNNTIKASAKMDSLLAALIIQPSRYYQSSPGVLTYKKSDTLKKTDSNFNIAKVQQVSPMINALKVQRSDIESDVNGIRNLPNKLKLGSFLKIDNTAIYIFYGIFILVFGVTTSFYRFHLKEVSKYEHFLFGFERIRIAGNNSKTGYDDEVKISLTKDAFSNEIKVQSKEISKKIESPIPGHPTSDFASLIFNKILDAVDVSPKKN